MISIKELNKDKIEDFFQYLNSHLSENGRNNTLLFQPLSREQSTITTEWKSKFENGINKKYGEFGWRKTWIATNNQNKIMGHIDIRSNNLLNSEHRVLLGMGVASEFRNLKMGHKLLKFVIEYCKNNNQIYWIDLELLTNNIPAKKLYEKNNFKLVGVKTDMFRIDAVSYDYTHMTLNVENYNP